MLAAAVSFYSIVLFLHVTGAVLVFAGIGILIFGTVALRGAKSVEHVRALARPLVAGRRVGFEHISVIDVVTVAGILIVAASGLYLGLAVWGWQSGWVKVAIVSFALMAPIGPAIINPRLLAIASSAEQLPNGPVEQSLRRLIVDPMLGIPLQALAFWLLGLVFLMTNKPAFGESVGVMCAALLVGVASGVPVWLRKQPVG